MKKIQRHMDAEDLERYSIGNNSEEESEPLEEHLLTCDDCRERLRETDDYLLALRTTAVQLRREEQFTQGREWRVPAWFPALAAVACLFLVVFALRLGGPAGPVAAVSLTALRSNGAGSLAPAGRELMLYPDLTGLTDASSYRLEIVDQTGRPVRQLTLARAQNGIRVRGLAQVCSLFGCIYAAENCFANTGCNSSSGSPQSTSPSWKVRLTCGQLPVIGASQVCRGTTRVALAGCITPRERLH